MIAADLLFPTINTIYTILTAGSLATTDLLCPECAVAIGGMFTLGGTTIDIALKGGSAIVQQEMYQIVADQLESMIGSFGFDDSNKHEMLVGIQTMLKSNAEENRQMFKGIKVALKSFEDNMDKKFLELKSFIIEKDFTEKILQPMDRLWKLMKNVDEFQTEDSVEQFLIQYKSNSARAILADYITRLNYVHTNPIVSAMELNVLDSRSILDKHTYLLSDFIFQMLAIEGCYYAVSDRPKNGTDAYMDAISKDADSAMRSFREFVANYKMRPELYWPDLVTKTVDSTNMEGSDLNAAAERLQQILQGIYTTDVFAIYLWNYDADNQGEEYHHYVAKSYFPEITNKELPGHIVVSRNNGNGITKACVQRSFAFHEMREISYYENRASYRAHAFTHKTIFEKMGHQFSKDSHGFSYFSSHEHYFKHSDRVHGFAVYNVKPVVRHTNNGYSLLVDDDLKITPFYYGLTWL